MAPKPPDNCRVLLRSDHNERPTVVGRLLAVDSRDKPLRRVRVNVLKGYDHLPKLGKVTAGQLIQLGGHVDGPLIMFTPTNLFCRPCERESTAHSLVRI